jgi:signal recognition particle GTPase
MGFFTQIKEKLVGKSTKQNEKYVVGLDKSSETFSDRINELAARFREINDEYFEELENILIMADVGVSMVMKIVSEIKTEVRIRNIVDSLDPYWSGKIVGEEIRKFEKNEFSKRLQKIVNCYLEDKIKSMKHIVEEQKKL